MPSPRVFIIRHGETAWSLNGRHTGVSDIPLTPSGEKRVRATGKALVGDDRLIVPGNLAHIYVSPRTRAQRTLELLDLGCRERYPWKQPDAPGALDPRTNAHVQITSAVREWDYGDYEGLTSSQIHASNPTWDIWRDGCPGGESADAISLRLDALIAEIRQKFHAGKFGNEDGCRPNDVLIVAHGHILRAFAARWIGRRLEDNPGLILEAGGVGTLSYEHNSIDEPAILLGGAFVVDVVEKDDGEKK
ncbi:phosphoglycerate mutase family protein-like protein [Ophiobolus disseminans]|uniref:Phosphoglycerate mutase family protein-like protein n=1 Tax=Ophiobolus disseminans TaxID=1469910 RepID=A0A6A7ACB5_9PLEO|nr:phosphoglycerate mutase family protein-like protein [Ophiobolus disseminans]